MHCAAHTMRPPVTATLKWESHTLIHFVSSCDSSLRECSSEFRVFRFAGDINAAAINASGRKILDYASDSSSDVETPTVSNTWRGQDLDNSDNESIDSQSEDLLKWVLSRRLLLHVWIRLNAPLFALSFQTCGSVHHRTSYQNHKREIDAAAIALHRSIVSAEAHSAREATKLLPQSACRTRNLMYVPDSSSIEASNVLQLSNFGPFFSISNSQAVFMTNQRTPSASVSCTRNWRL